MNDMHNTLAWALIIVAVAIFSAIGPILDDEWNWKLSDTKAYYLALFLIAIGGKFLWMGLELL